MTAARPLRLVFHIGDGKTGTSSIQDSLRANRAVLEKHGVWYLGQMLELAPGPRMPWQRANAGEEFVRLPPARAGAELQQVLGAIVSAARAAGAGLLIWSNEVFFGRADAAWAPLRALREEGVQVDVVAYVRRHDAWLQSAYLQWALRHKTHAGPVQPFREWAARRHKRFTLALKRVEKELPGALVVRNFDAVGDTLADFLGLTGLGELGLQMVRSNETPSGAELVMRALFNTRVEGKAPIRLFNRAAGGEPQFRRSASAYLRALLPGEEDLAAARARCATDRVRLNRLLAAQGQPPVATGALAPRSAAVDESELLFALCDLVMHQAHRIEQLEQRLAGGGVTEPRA